jgi:hypothetical protein
VDWTEFVDAPERLWQSWNSGEIRDELLGGFVRRTWMDTEYPLERLSQDKWLAMFETTGFLGMPKDWPIGQEPTTDWAQLYRGHDRDHMTGMSWTTSLKCARWFADRDKKGRPQTYVFVVTAPLGSVLANFPNRLEQEIVVDPRRLIGAYAPVEFEKRPR